MKFKLEVAEMFLLNKGVWELYINIKVICITET